VSVQFDKAIIPLGARKPLRKAQNLVFVWLTGLFAFLLILPLVILLWYLLSRGVQSLSWDFFTQIPKPVGETGGGVANAIVGSVIILGLASVFAVPVGILAAVYMSDFGRGNRISSTIRFACDMLNATPSIILGIFSYSIIVLTMGRFSALAGSFALFVMMAPVVVRGTEEILQLVPDSFREASLALGASRSQTIWRVVLPAARGGITTTVALSLARISGETAPLLFTALGNEFWNFHIDRPMNTLPVQIYKFATSPYEDWHRQAWAAALVLILLISVTNAVARFATRRR
jgi:phosphate transport system permease protein